MPLHPLVSFSMLETEQQRVRFHRAFEDSLEKRRQYLNNRRKFLKELVGQHWGPPTVSNHESIPVNLIEKAHTILTRLLVSQHPRVLVRSPYQQLKATADDCEELLNHELRKTHLDRVLSRWVGASMFGLAVVKCGLEYTGQMTHPETGVQMHVGQIRAFNISLDDYVHDMAARSLEPDSMRFVGDMFRIPLEEARNNPLYDEEARMSLGPDDRKDTNKYGQRRVEEMGAHNKLEVEDHVELWELWFPKEQMIAIWDGKTHHKPLYMGQWTGPEGGPYHYLYYTPIEDQSMPLPPAAMWYDIHKTVNEVYRKEQEAAENAKDNLLYEEGEDEDAQRIVDSGHLETVAVSNIDRIKQVRWNGARPEGIAFMQQSMDLANNMAGNLDLLGGTSAQSPTATQDQMLSQAASARIDAMKDAVYKATQGLLEHWAWYYWHDPIRTYAGVRQVPHTNLHVPILITPEERQNNWARFNMVVEPFSLHRRSPEMVMNQLDQLMMQLIMPLAMSGGLQQMGLAPNIKQYLELKAKYLNLDEIKQLIQTAEPWMLDQMGPVGQRNRPTQSPVTSRTNIRENRSMGEPGVGQQMASRFMGSAMGRQNGEAINAR